MNKVIYIGNSLRVAEAIYRLKDVELLAVIYQTGKVSAAEISRSMIPCEHIGVNSKRSLTDACRDYYGKVDFAVMYSFGIILPEELTKEMEIYNFHPGDLRDNRGSSPINWSILLNRRETKMTLHKVGKEIDLGEVISEHICNIYPHDVPSTLSARMSGEIPSMVLELISFRQSKKMPTIIAHGVYRQRIREEDYTIHPEDSDEMIDAKIRSQYDYGGAIVLKDGFKMQVDSMEAYRTVIRGHSI